MGELGKDWLRELLGVFGIERELRRHRLLPAYAFLTL